MKICLATDHAGFEMKEAIKLSLIEGGHEVLDEGAYRLDPADDYTGIMKEVGRKVAGKMCERGIIFGGSGEGEAIAANRVRGVRAVVYYGGARDIIRLSREHNDANILSLGARFLDANEVKDVVRMWLETPFSGEERHLRRIRKLDQT